MLRLTTRLRATKSNYRSIIAKRHGRKRKGDFVASGELEDYFKWHQ